jgi:hypothetical protein
MTKECMATGGVCPELPQLEEGVVRNAAETEGQGFGKSECARGDGD